MIPSTGTDEYGDFLNEVISLLMTVKDSLKRGKSRKENRKEIEQLQSAIKACRHLKRKNDRKVSREMSFNTINENFTSSDIRKFLLGIDSDD